MLETVERISNISKCRDLINFELLLYRTAGVLWMFFLFVKDPIRIREGKSERKEIRTRGQVYGILAV